MQWRFWETKRHHEKQVEAFRDAMFTLRGRAWELHIRGFDIAKIQEEAFESGLCFARHKVPFVGDQEADQGDQKAVYYAVKLRKAELEVQQLRLLTKQLQIQCERMKVQQDALSQNLSCALTYGRKSA